MRAGQGRAFPRGLCVAFLACIQPAAAQETGGFAREVGAGARINEAGRLRMLSQRVAAMACYDAAGIEEIAPRRELTAAMDTFERILDALDSGDEALGILGAESDPRILDRIVTLRAIWEPLRASIEANGDAGSGGDVGEIYLQAEPLLDTARWLVTDVSGRYANPIALTRAEALRIDIAGRQRMLSQRMSKSFCFARSGSQVEAARAEFREASDIFDASLRALRFGMPTAGVNATEDPEILSALDEILADWDGLSERIEAVSDGAPSDEAEVVAFVRVMDDLLARMNAVVGLYAEVSAAGP